MSNGRDAGSNISELEKAQRVHDEAITNAILSDDKKEWEAHAEVAARALAKIITLTKGVVP